MATNNATNAGVLTANGQLLIGSTGVNSVPATLTAGTNVSITNGPGSITINASGGTAANIGQLYPIMIGAFSN